MSKKLFWQIVLLIVIANAVYFATVQLINWRTNQLYERRLQEARTTAEEEAKAHARASEEADQLEAREVNGASLDDTNENMIDGQVVHREGANWVNDQGQFVEEAGD